MAVDILSIFRRLLASKALSTTPPPATKRKPIATNEYLSQAQWRTLEKQYEGTSFTLPIEKKLIARKKAREADRAKEKVRKDEAATKKKARASRPPPARKTSVPNPTGSTPYIPGKGPFQPGTSRSRELGPQATTQGPHGAVSQAAAALGIKFGAMWPHPEGSREGMFADINYTNVCAFLNWREQEANGPLPAGTSNPFFEQIFAHLERARANGMEVKGSSLVWSDPTTMPDWLKAETDPARLSKFMDDHITNMVNTFKDKGIKVWDVINEPIAPDGSGLRDNPLTRHLGQDYIAQALRTAHAADPQARLIINEYGIEQGGPKFEALLELVKDLKSKGVPLDEIGLECKLTDQNSFDKEKFADVLRQFKEAGVTVNISEMDVTNAQVAKDVVSTIAASGICTGITMAGGKSKDWEEERKGLWTQGGEPNDRYFAVLEALQSVQPPPK